MGFICIDNPGALTERMELLCKTAVLVEQILFHDVENDSEILHKLVEKKMDHDILSVSGLGLWQMKINKSTGEVTVLADDTMKKLLGVKNDITPTECYQAWADSIDKDYLDYVKDAKDTVMFTDKTVQIEYPGTTPQRGKVTIRCVGTKTSENDTMMTVDGYYRILEDMIQIRKKGIPEAE